MDQAGNLTEKDNVTVTFTFNELANLTLLLQMGFTSARPTWAKKLCTKIHKCALDQHPTLFPARTKELHKTSVLKPNQETFNGPTDT